MRYSLLIPLVLGIVRALARGHETRIAFGKRSAMDDCMLKNIGISRAQIEYEVASRAPNADPLCRASFGDALMLVVDALYR